MQTPVILQTENQYMISLFPPYLGEDPVFVQNIGFHRTPPLHTYGPAVRPYYLLHLIIKGKGEFERGGETRKLGAGEAFWIFPDEVTVYRADEKEPWEYCWIAFNGSFAPELVKRTVDRFYTSYKKSGLLALQAAINGKTTDSVQLLNVLFSVLSAVQDRPEREQSETDVVAEAVRYLENGYFEEIDVARLAASFGYSRAYFSTLFAQKTGESPYRFLTRLRIEKAKEYLKSNRLSVEEIAYSVGFSSLVRFSELFKKYTGASPSQYRNAHFS